MKQGMTIQAAAAEIQRQAATKRDFVVDAPAVTLAQTETSNLGLQFRTGNSLELMPVTNHVHSQLSQWAGIPAKYYHRMRENSPGLLQYNVNHWMQQSPDKRMIRSLDGHVRAWLSNRYRRLDNWDLLRKILPVLDEVSKAYGQANVNVVSCNISERYFHLKLTFPHITAEIKVGDVVEAGVSFRNSEIGGSPIEIVAFVNRLSCMNGMKTPVGISRRHIGRALSSDDDSEAYELFSDETLAADDEAVWRKLTDLTRATCNQAKFELIADKLRDTTEQGIEGNPSKVVRELTNTVDLSENEGEQILRHLIEGADMTRYGMIQAVTRTSQDIEDYDRADDLESAGGKILQLPQNVWDVIAKAK